MELSGHLDFAVVLQKKKKRISNRENKKKIERGGKEVRGVPSARGKRELWGGEEEEEEDRRTDTYTSRASLRGTSQIMESASRLRLVYTPLTPSADVLSAKTSMGCAPSALAQLRRLSPICFSDETADTLS